MEGHTQAKSELKPRLNLLLIEAAIVDEQIPRAVVAIDDLGTVVVGLLRDSVGKLAAGRSVTVENVSKPVSGFLPRQTGPDNSDDVRIVNVRLEDKRADTVDHNDGLLVDSRDGFDEVVAVVP